ncbi:MAG: DUF3040 domain-containing protein [Propionibacteriaceae bacterium]|jgi:preprotein translocase subunit SecF|nr:DUF3040 domain-containing protein [Propionibacteriaceae bacterium]
MALSEEEQKLLAELEAQLVEEDPRLADRMRGSSQRKINARRAALAGLLFVAGLVALVLGIRYGWLLSVAGFVAMLGAALIALKSWKFVDSHSDGHFDADHERPFSL